jgi:hypothetical protein
MAKSAFFYLGAGTACVKNVFSNLVIDIPVDKIKDDLKAGISETNVAIEDRRLTRLAESHIRQQLQESADEQHQQIVEIVKQELANQQTK